MIKKILILSLYLVTNLAFADSETQRFILDAKKHEQEFIQNFSNIANEAKNNKSIISSSFKEEAKRANFESQQFLANNKIAFKESTPTVIIFVSFSMPEESLISYVRDAKKVHASVIIRGLINNSFKDTFLKMASIVKKVGDGGVELNPPLFKKFNVTHVPAVVVLPTNEINDTNTSHFGEGDFDVVFGDIPLFDALKTVRDHGEVSKVKAGELVTVMDDSL